MKKPYSGNEKPYIVALFHCADRDKAMPVLEKLEKDGIEIYGQDGKHRKFKSRKASAFVLFVSEHFAADAGNRELMTLARDNQVPMLAVRYDDVKLPEDMEKLLAEQDSIVAGEKTAEELAAWMEQTESLDPPRVTELQKRCARIRTALVSTAVLAALVAAVLSFGQKAFGWFSPSAKQMMDRSWARADLTLLEHLLH